MTAVVCLQGGAEFNPGCEAMDSAMIAAAAPGPVLIAAFAGRPGRERSIASANARRWYAGLGATDIEIADDEGPSFTDALARTGLLVLPGGSPQRLLDALTPYAEALRMAREAGAAISGASAGAMVLCRQTVLPGPRPMVVPALGLVDVDLVVPHFDGGRRWLDATRAALPTDALVLGLPERSGVLLHPDGRREGAGVSPWRRLTP